MIIRLPHMFPLLVTHAAIPSALLGKLSMLISEVEDTLGLTCKGKPKRDPCIDGGDC